MKCTNCKTEFDGKFCPNCGAKCEAETPSPAPQPAPATTAKKKKPFFLRWWFILVAILVVGIIALSIGGGGEKIVWSDIILGEMLPEPPGKKGEVHSNSADDLWIDINKISEKQFADYVADCQEKGFVIEEESNSSSFNAYNAAGYKLSLSHYDSDAEMTIQLDPPMELSTIQWPASTAGALLPTPKSTTGKFSYEHDDNFYVYVGNTTKADYNEYVTACSEKGFNADYDKGEDYYYADNSSGWHLSLRYEGNGIMSINIDAPSEDDTNIDESNSTTADTEPNTGDLDADFKAAMDSYEEFMDEYVAFMKKYSADPTDISLLSDYATYMSEYTALCEDFAAWETEELTAAETAYYIEVQTRVNQKLLEIAQ